MEQKTKTEYHFTDEDVREALEDYFSLEIADSYAVWTNNQDGSVDLVVSDE